jgi:hypothetical protein
VSTLGERIDAIRATVEERHEAHRRLGLPQVQVVRDTLLALERTFATHPVLQGEREPWCRRCLMNWPCQEVRAGEVLLGVIETTETNGLERGVRPDDN